MAYNYYLLTDPSDGQPSSTIRRQNPDETNTFIPADPANTDYQEYLAWLAEGNTPEPAPEPEPAPVLTPEEKLAASGLTVEELKTLLNLPSDD